ncbi:hypothetical protein NC653_028791 [Populus alba x Populus x berolinensis]|uniref:Uncharacterized protein n=1 Tax=Populus alba x Populus x berolinensis TaxID=444605 RepID=A0AAD6Q2M8_9ROSI|nr:hypothetical protein NC653_028791 [Populus alba x Populus x berolinensis]
MSWNVQLQRICKKTITQTASHPPSQRVSWKHWLRESDWLLPSRKLLWLWMRNRPGGREITRSEEGLLSLGTCG